MNELNKQRVLKVELQGRRPGKSSKLDHIRFAPIRLSRMKNFDLIFFSGSFVVLTPNLPGEPDNVRAASDGSGYWVAVNLARKDDTPSFYDYLADQPCSSESFIAFNEMVASYMNFLAENTGTLAFQNVAERVSEMRFVGVDEHYLDDLPLEKSKYQHESHADIWTSSRNLKMLPHY